jgi:hypothetical protein
MRTYNVVHHDIHATELRPHLNAHTENNTFEHTGGHKSLEAIDRLFTLKSESVFDFVILGEDLGVVDIATSVKVGESLEGLLPLVFAGEPTGRAREEKHADEQDEGGDHLNAPGNAEGSSALGWVLGSSIDERCSVLNEVLDQNSPMTY